MKRLPAVDLDHRQPLAIGLLEGRIAGDVDLAQLEPELVAEPPHLLERALAEMAPLRVVDDDLGALRVDAARDRRLGDALDAEPVRGDAHRHVARSATSPRSPRTRGS